MVTHLEENCRCECGEKLTFKEETLGGLATRMIQECSSCKKKCSWDSCEKIGPRRNISEINRRTVMTARTLGLGYKQLKKLCAHMELLPPTQESSFYQIVRTIHSAAQTQANNSMKRAASEEAELIGSTDLTVSGDGSWQKRGHNSLNGVVTVIGVQTGKVLDVEVLSRACPACAQYSLDRESEEFETWYLTHVSECQANHLGSSSKMESDGMTSIFKRSVETRQVRYVTFVGDGDSSTFPNLEKAEPYPGVKLVKKECIGHVQKRMGRAMKKFKEEQKGRKLADGKGLGGMGRLTDEAILKIQSYYGKAIRENSDSQEKMANAVMAIFHHLTSTNENHNHSLCPEGKDSWCGYRRAEERGEADSFHHPKPKIAPICIQAAKSVFEAQCNASILKRCVGAFNQNPNESLNNVIWCYAPKEKFCGRRVIEIAVAFAVLDFNDGQTAKLELYRSLHLKVGIKLQSWAIECDALRLEQAERSVERRSKEARQAKRRKTAADEERMREEEGLYYEYGAF